MAENNPTPNDLMGMSDSEVANLSEQINQGAMPVDQSQLTSTQPPDARKAAADNLLNDVSTQPLIPFANMTAPLKSAGIEVLPGVMDPSAPQAPAPAAPQEDPNQPQQPSEEEMQQTLDQAAQYQRTANQIQAKAAEQEYELDTRIAEMDSQIAQMDKIDPNRFWNSKSTGDKLTVGLGLLIAGVGAGLTGGPNSVIDMIEKAIDRDVAAQKVDLETALAKKKFAFEKMQMELKRRAAATPDPLKQVQLMNAYQQFEQNKMKTAEMQRDQAAGGKLGGEERKMLGIVRGGVRAIVGMEAALAAGDNTFSVIGDSDYTRNARMAAEMFGRKQSGGAINEDEEARFMDMLPRVTDSKDIQKKKMRQVRREFEDVMKDLGRDPNQLIAEQVVSAAEKRSVKGFTDVFVSKHNRLPSRSEVNAYIRAKRGI